MEPQLASAQGSSFLQGDTSHARRLEDGRQTLVRPMRADDYLLYPEFARHVTGEDHRLRFFTQAGGLAPENAWRFTHYDPREARAFIAIDPDQGSMLGVARVHRTDAAAAGEFAVLVRSDLKGLGLGRELMDAALGGAVELGLETIWGLVLRENTHMLALCRDLGFGISSCTGDPGVVVARRPVTLL